MVGVVGSGLGSPARAAEPAVVPLGAFPLALPGLQVKPDARPRVLLWCRGVRLLGLMLPGDDVASAAPRPQGRAGAMAFLLRDGRCEADERVSFGFLVPLKGWVFEGTAGRSGRPVPEERVAWLLHRFEGSTKGGRLSGALVQVDVNHPGYPFRQATVEAERQPEDQTPFEDATAWLASVTRTFSLAQDQP